jgi:DNA-binding phage protein
MAPARKTAKIHPYDSAEYLSSCAAIQAYTEEALSTLDFVDVCQRGDEVRQRELG